MYLIFLNIFYNCSFCVKFAFRKFKKKYFFLSKLRLSYIFLSIRLSDCFLCSSLTLLRRSYYNKQMNFLSHPPQFAAELYRKQKLSKLRRLENTITIIFIPAFFRVTDPWWDWLNSESTRFKWNRNRLDKINLTYSIFFNIFIHNVVKSKKIWNILNLLTLKKEY